MQENYFLGISGIIGAGKTTLGIGLSESLGIEVYKEPVLDNPFLDKFYDSLEAYKKNPNDKKIKKELQKNSFELQEFFLLSRVIDHKKIIAKNTSIIQDRTIYEDEVFANYNHKLETISKEGYEKYLRLYNELVPDLKIPDLLIHLDVSLDVAKKRIKKRGRKSEMELIEPGNTYLEGLHLEYQNFIQNYQGNKLIILGNNLDFVNKKEDLEEIVNMVKDKLDWRQ